MRKAAITAFILGLLMIVVWTVSLGLDVESKIHYLHLRYSEKTTVIPLPSSSFATSVTVADHRSDYETYPVPVPKDHPPLKIVCGPYVFHVVYASHDWLDRNNAYAMSDNNKRIIVLDRQRNATDVREDVLHELIHISLWEGGGKSVRYNEEENYVKPIAISLRDILVDNPALLKWLVKAGG